MARSTTNALKHGDARPGQVARLHSLWRGMLKRAGTGYRSKHTSYRERGISVCEGWHDYVTFRTWALANGYTEELTLDRIDNDGNYTPENCRWATRSQQARNRRTSRLLTASGKTQTMAAWAEETGIGTSTISTRLNRGWSDERAVMTPPLPIPGRPRKTA